jgi:hypothetical protein
VNEAKQIETWDYTNILEWCGEKKTTWKVVPGGAQAELHNTDGDI